MYSGWSLCLQNVLLQRCAQDNKIVNSLLRQAQRINREGRAFNYWPGPSCPKRSLNNRDLCAKLNTYRTFDHGQKKKKSFHDTNK